MSIRQQGAGVPLQHKPTPYEKRLAKRRMEHELANTKTELEEALTKVKQLGEVLEVVRQGHQLDRDTMLQNLKKWEDKYNNLRVENRRLNAAFQTLREASKLAHAQLENIYRGWALQVQTAESIADPPPHSQTAGKGITVHNAGEPGGWVKGEGTRE